MTRPAKFLWFTSGAVGMMAVVAVGVHLWIRARPDEPWRQFPGWRGTQLTYCAPVPKAVCQAFADDPPAPEKRRRFCERFLGAKSKPRCVGWLAEVSSVVRDGAGWRIVLTVTPQLEPGTWYTNAKTVETWRVSGNGRVRCNDCETGGPFLVTRD